MSTEPKTLEQIVGAINDLLSRVEEQEGEVYPEQEAFLADLEGRLQDKIEAICAVYRKAEQDMGVQEEEIKRLRARKQAFKNRSERLKDYLRFCLERLGTTSYQGALHSVRIQRSSPSVNWLGPVETIPAEFARVVPAETKLDRDAVFKAQREGRELPKDMIVESGTHLVIR